MMDVVGAIVIGVFYATLVGALVGLSGVSRQAQLAARIAAVLWLALIMALGATGRFATGVTRPVPAPVIAFALLLALLFVLWSFVPRFRNALLSVPLPVLVGLNVLRVGGIFFLLLHAQHRLAAPFAPIAGWGDITVGLLAIPLAVVAAGTHWKDGFAIRVWNIFGALDLTTAILLGALSSPGTPFRLFTEEPGTQAMTSLPWVLVPAAFVPVYFLIHRIIAVKIGKRSGLASERI